MSHRAKRSRRFRALTILLAASLAFCVVRSTSQAHDAAIAVGGERIRVKTPRNPEKSRFRAVVKSVRLGLPEHDPSTTTTWLLVRGYGENADTSGRIVLDSSRWSPIRPRQGTKGYRYLDPSRASGGIRRVILKPGRMLFAGGGPNWPWTVGGDHSSVWVHFGLEEESYCAAFGGVIEQNRTGLFRATTGQAPAACPSALCGNGEVEVDEACDDGNLDDDDGCTRYCETAECIGDEYESTFAAIQELIFEQNSCNNSVCHGAAPGAGDLNLLSTAAYENLVDVPSNGSALSRVSPSAPRQSSLFLKLLKAHEPTTDIPGAAMPSGAPPIHEDLLEALRVWILGGAPESGTVAAAAPLLGGCFPEPTPISITPLPAPEPAAGVQFSMPKYELPPQSESEICVATYYDLSGIVPPEFVDPSGEFVYNFARISRQDPHSHHLVALYSGVTAENVDHESFGTWTCAAGPTPGAICDPLVLDACGQGGVCASEVKDAVACIGYGPPGSGSSVDTSAVIAFVAAGSNAVIEKPGFYAKLPIRGVMYWNSHAFNATNVPHKMNAWLNVLYTDDLQHEVYDIRDVRSVFVQDGQPPFTRETYCEDLVLPRGTRVVNLSSHTHQRGEYFWIEYPVGQMIYESFDYADPVQRDYEPALEFDGVTDEERTLRYCAIYSNGLAPDGSLDPSSVRRTSITAPNGEPCVPTHCAVGRVGEPCGGVDDDATCDSFLGSGDGACDACALTGGVTTQDEMFIVIGRAYRIDLP